MSGTSLAACRTEKVFRRKGDNIMRNKVISALLAGALSIAPALYGQEQSPGQRKQAQADRAGQETLTGCLTEDQGSFTLATQAGEQVSVSGSQDLMKHKGHTVKLTGTTSNEGGKKTLTVSKIEHVSPSCAK